MAHAKLCFRNADQQTPWTHFNPSLTQSQTNLNGGLAQYAFSSSQHEGPAAQCHNWLIFSTNAKTLWPAKWVWHGSALILSRKWHKSHQITFLSGSTFRLIFLIFFVKVLVPLTW